MKTFITIVLGSGFFLFSTLQATTLTPSKSSKNVKIVIYVPETHADIVRQAMGKAGAGKIGDYDFCSFSIKGMGRFRPLAGANPTIGKVGAFETVPEERIEAICPSDCVKEVIAAVKKVHPYEEMGLDIYPLVDCP